MNKSIFKTAVAVTAAALFCMGCSGDDGDGNSGSNTQLSPNPPPVAAPVYGAPAAYGGETYQTVVIGTQTWFARNLNYKVIGNGADTGKCYNNRADSCAKYGRLYDWAAAMNLPAFYNSNTASSQTGTPHQGICPAGWHIPTNAEWDQLYRYADRTSGTSSLYDSPTAGKYLKAASGWNGGGNGTDIYGFAAFPGGRSYSDGYFHDAGNVSYWWSATENMADYAYSRDMHYDDERARLNGFDKKYLFSVRCVLD